MSRPLRAIRCFSSDDKLQNVFRSMIRVYSQFSHSGLRHEWNYCEHSHLDVQILDLDDEDCWARFAAFPELIVIAISRRPELLAGQKYALDKPLRSHSLLQILQHIETAEPVRGAGGAAIADSGPGTDFTDLRLDSQEPALPVREEAAAAATDLIYKLKAWPDLTAMPADRVHDISRVCALLSTRPASLDFLEVFLEIPAGELEHLLVLIRQHAHEGFPTLADAPRLTHPAAESLHIANNAPARPSSFLSKIWNRLKGAA